MPDINNFRQLDFQEVGEPADSDRVLVVEVENGKVVGAKNYDLSKLKGHISAEALAYLEECRSIKASVSEAAETLNNIATQSTELLETTRGETIESLEQTVTSTEPGGVNVFTITQKNGTQKSFQNRNGLRGPEGPQGPQGPAVPLVQTTGTSTTSAMSQNAVSEQLNQLKNTLINKIYPIGSIYMSLKNISPASFLGGNWTQIKSKFLLGADVDFETNTIPTFKTETEGGNETVTLSLSQIPSHYGHLYDEWLNKGTAKGRYLNNSHTAEYGTDGRGWDAKYGSEYYPAGQSLGGGQPHNNMPPYKVVFMWQRVED